MTDTGNIVLDKLRELEQRHDIAAGFATMGSSSWVTIKNAVFEHSLSHLNFKRHNRNQFFSWKLAVIIFVSVWHYLCCIARSRPAPLFIGAGSGLITGDDVTRDSYLPGALSSSQPGIPREDLIYCLSADDLNRLWRQRNYLTDHQAILYSFVVAPLRAILARLVHPFIVRNNTVAIASRQVSECMREAGVDCPPGLITALHARFFAGHMLYRIAFAPLRISEAYVVSAYSNSESCAALRRKGVHITEVQHGIVGPTHRGYNYATHDPRLPVPDSICVYDDFWRTELLDAGFFPASAIEIGSRLKYQMAKNERVPLAGRYVVFTGQGILQEQVVAFIRGYGESRVSLPLVYIPHPTESEEYLEAIEREVRQQANVLLVRSTRCSTEALIMHSVGHVSIYSSCHFDSIHYLGRTFVFDVLPESVMHYYTRRRTDRFIPITSPAQFLVILGDKSA